MKQVQLNYSPHLPPLPPWTLANTAFVADQQCRSAVLAAGFADMHPFQDHPAPYKDRRTMIGNHIPSVAHDMVFQWNRIFVGNPGSEVLFPRHTAGTLHNPS